jgi:hypothetical protein
LAEYFLAFSRRDFTILFIQYHDSQIFLFDIEVLEFSLMRKLYVVFRYEVPLEIFIVDAVFLPI